MWQFGILKLLGLLTLLLWVYWYVKRLFFTKPFSLSERYGRNSWVVITGGSEGIGLGFAKRLAQEGFNLVLISRSEEKLKKAKEELLHVNQLIDVLTISMDFANSHKASFFDELEKKLEGLDISILINNVGTLPSNGFNDQSSQEVRDTIVINCCSQVGMYKLILPKLQKRKLRGAVIDMASGAAYAPMPIMPSYSGTKAFMEFFSRGLGLYANNVDILSVTSGCVCTAMTNFRPIGKGSSALNKSVSVEDTTEGILNLLGQSTTSCGAWKNNLVQSLLPAILALIPHDLVWHILKRNKPLNDLELYRSF